MVNTPAAQAATGYYNDACGYSSPFSCFSLHYNTIAHDGGLSPCFISNDSISDYWGYSPNGVAVVRYMFGYYSTSDGAQMCPYGSSSAGVGDSVKNNAGSANNGDSAAYRIYFNSGYAGHSQYFGARTTLKDLDSTLHNDNASQKRL